MVSGLGVHHHIFTGAERREWMAMGVAGMIKIIAMDWIMKPHSLRSRKLQITRQSPETMEKQFGIRRRLGFEARKQ